MMTKSPLSLSDIQNAASNLSQHITPTPQRHSPNLSQRLGCDIFLKQENMHITSSFKERGAITKILSLTPEQREKGVVAMSAGNHAQAVAYHATRLGIKSTIIMPERSPIIKINKTKAYGATVKLYGRVLSESGVLAYEMVEKEGVSIIHPYDDIEIIKGQGTAGLELLNEFPDLDVLIVPIGGGGIISGISTVAKALNPRIRIIGVQSELYPYMGYHIQGKTDIPHDMPLTLADGIAVKKPGELTSEIIEKNVDNIVFVSETLIEKAIGLLIQTDKTVVEGAGATPLAAVLQNPDAFAGKKVGLVLTGGNIDHDLLQNVLARHLVQEEMVKHYAVTIQDSPRYFNDVVRIITEKRGQIRNVSYDRVFAAPSARQTVVNLTLALSSKEHEQEMCEALEQAGYPTTHVHYEA